MPHFVRSLVGLDEATAKQAFSRFIEDTRLTATQIRFVEMMIEQLTARGMMDARALCEPPFSHLHSGGPGAVFTSKEKVLDGLFDRVSELNRIEATGSRSAS